MNKRETHFRAWNKKTKQLEPVLLICFVNKYVDVLPEQNLEGGSQESWGFQDIELIQYTGLKDKNRKNIYEGDIVERTINQGLRSEQIANWVIKWGTWCYMRYLRASTLIWEAKID